MGSHGGGARAGRALRSVVGFADTSKEGQSSCRSGALVGTGDPKKDPRISRQVSARRANANASSNNNNTGNNAGKRHTYHRILTCQGFGRLV